MSKIYRMNTNGQWQEIGLDKEYDDQYKYYGLPDRTFSSYMTLDPATPSMNGVFGSVYCMAVQKDGKVLVGGNLSAFNNKSVNNIFRLHPNGTLDDSFQAPYIDNDVFAIEVQDDGKILIGGYFEYVDDQKVDYIARLNYNGSLDYQFLSNNGTGFVFNDSSDRRVEVIKVQSDGKILVGGYFNTFNGTNVDCILRLNSNGSLDTTFISNLGTLNFAAVYAIGIQATGKIIVAGDYSNYGSAADYYSSQFIRLNSNGSFDNTFELGKRFLYGSSSSSAFIYAISILSDDSIIMGGIFDEIESTDGNITFNGESQISIGNIFKFNSDGTANLLFDSNIKNGFDNYIWSIKNDSEGYLILGGDFESVDSTPSSRICRLSPYGKIDNKFISNTGLGITVDGTPSNYAQVKSIVIQPSGKIVFGGSFNYVDDIYTEGIGRLKINNSGDDGGGRNGTFADAQPIHYIDSNYTLIESDMGSLISTYSNVATSLTITVPPNSTLNAKTGSYVDIMQAGTGQITISGPSVSLLLASATPRTRALYSRIGLQYLGSDQWSVFGDLG